MVPCRSVEWFNAPALEHLLSQTLPPHPVFFAVIGLQVMSCDTFAVREPQCPAVCHVAMPVADMSAALHHEVSLTWSPCAGLPDTGENRARCRQELRMKQFSWRRSLDGFPGEAAHTHMRAGGCLLVGTCTLTRPLSSARRRMTKARAATR